MSATLKAYYLAKPLIPWRVRNWMRRLHANRVRSRSDKIWPINESCSHPPEKWQGWPEGKKFGFTLTHDVEGQSGYDKCKALVAVEKAQGFRSSFNFVPEGEYEVRPEMLALLENEGFETGVHGLHHDGKLYDSAQKFSQRAERINGYLSKWNATGFRSPLMHHNLDWIHQLEIDYDLSTFDTDPFEPQPDPASTVFPFWVPRDHHKSSKTVDANSGYIELPYTLPQDSTLFLVLREQTADIWKRKLDWLANKGAMALLNVHPDYIQFPGEKPSAYTYPLELYVDFLKHVREQHSDRCWHALPRDLASFSKSVLRSG